MDNALQDRLERIRANVGITDICPDLKPQGTNTCPSCGKRGKFSVWNNTHGKCWSASCSLNKSSDVISLYRFIKRLDDSKGFITALNELEKMAGISNFNFSASNSRDDTLQECLNIYSHYLWSSAGKDALNYLRSRGFADETIQLQQIGYAPNGSSLRSFEIDVNRLREEGLLKNRTEYFSSRIIFPIRNMQGNLVHLVGRYLGDVPKDEYGEDALPRYKDTQGTKGLPGTKSYLAFEHLINSYLKTSDNLLILEGYPDTLSLVQGGLPAVGLLGLEKLVSHSYKIKNFKEITCIFDNDIFPADHPNFPLEYKSWRRIIPQLVDLQMLLPNVTFYVWMVPDISINSKGIRTKIKDINEWVVHTDLSFEEISQKINKERQELVPSLIDRWGSDLSQHSTLLKLITSVRMSPDALLKYIPPEMTPLEYALSIIGD